MSRIINQHTWKPLRRAPAILTVQEVREPWTPALSRIRQPYWTVDYEFQPAGQYRIGTVRTPWQPRLAHTMHLYPPRLTYWEDTRQQTGRRHSAWILFTGGESIRLHRFLHPRRRYARFEDPADRLGEVFRNAAAVGQRLGDDAFWKTQALFYELLDLLFQARRTDELTWRLDAENAERQPTFAETLEQYLSKHLGDPLTADDLARHLHISRSLLFHRLRRETGETPLALLARLRVAEAKRLLLQGLALKEIAPRLGFCDQFHLSKTFKRIEGLSPRAVRSMRK